MSSGWRVVFDTNALVSVLLAGASAPALAFAQIESSGILLASLATFAEFEEVIHRPKFDRYVSLGVRLEFLRRYREAAQLVPVKAEIRACRDPRDDKFLDLAVSGKAQCLLTGDTDLLALHPFRGVDILTPRIFLDRLEAARKASEKAQ